MIKTNVKAKSTLSLDARVLKQIKLKCVELDTNVSRLINELYSEFINEREFCTYIKKKACVQGNDMKKYIFTTYIDAELKELVKYELGSIPASKVINELFIEYLTDSLFEKCINERIKTETET